MKSIDTKDEALALLQAVVDEAGADHHPATVNGKRASLSVGARYFGNDHETPVCIIGHVMAKLGLTESDLTYLHGDGSIYNHGMNTTQFNLLRMSGVEMSQDAHRLFSYAQARQDAGMSWGSMLQWTYMYAASSQFPEYPRITK